MRVKKLSLNPDKTEVENMETPPPPASFKVVLALILEFHHPSFDNRSQITPFYHNNAFFPYKEAGMELKQDGLK